MSNCHPLEVVGRGSGTQLQVDENLNYLKITYIFYIVVFIVVRVVAGHTVSTEECCSFLLVRIYVTQQVFTWAL